MAVCLCGYLLNVKFLVGFDKIRQLSCGTLLRLMPSFRNQIRKLEMKFPNKLALQAKN